MNTTINSKKNLEEENKKKEAARWTPEQEGLLAEWAEKAACYRWLHTKSEKQYRCRNYSFTIPVIILSTLTGTANFAMDSFVPEAQKKMAMGIVGGVNIFAGILSTLQNFLRYAELMEGHRSSGVAWSKFSRNICVELALDEKRRKPAGDFLKICRAEFDRLIEQSPSVDEKIIKQFDYQFKDNDVIRPEICNGIKKCKIYKPSEEEKLSHILEDVSDKLLKKKDNLKTAKSWKKLDVKNYVERPDRKTPSVPVRDTEPIKDISKVTNNKDISEEKKPIIEEKKPITDIVLNIDPESDSKTESVNTDDNIDTFLDGINSDKI